MMVDGGDSVQSTEWYPIRGFETPSEYRRFVQHIESCIRDGIIVEVTTDLAYSDGEIYGGRWFQDIATSRTWRLVAPDFPLRGLWEPVNTAGDG
jgi:hypothetical protein